MGFERSSAFPFTVVQDVDQVVARLYGGDAAGQRPSRSVPTRGLSTFRVGVPSRERDASQFGGDEDVT